MVSAIIHHVRQDHWREFKEYADHVKKKSGMYFGRSGCDSVPVAITGFLTEIVRASQLDESSAVEVIISKRTERQQRFVIRFKGMQLPVFQVPQGKDWLKGWQERTKPWQIFAALGASRRFVIQRSEKRRRGTLKWSEDGTVSWTVAKGRFTPELRFMLELAPQVFPPIGHDHTYRLAGALKDLSCIHPGVQTTLRSNLLPGELRYLYREGLKSLLFEEEYTRHSMHGGCMDFSAAIEGMSMQCCLRFVHGGVSRVKSFVNGYPVQGGSHLQGLAQALKKAFPKGYRGCRGIPFITNSDTGAAVLLPHSFIGAMNLMLAEPKFYSPTRDVLDDPALADFVMKSATASLPDQLKFLGVR